MLYSVFQRFRQVKFVNGDSILSLSQFLLLPQKDETHFKSGQNQLENNHLATSI